MYRLLFLIYLLSPFFIKAQIITTFAGNGTGGNSGYGGPATAAEIAVPSTGAFDTQGDFIFVLASNSDRVCKVDGAGVITLVAGGLAGAGSFGGDGGPASAAIFNHPQAVAIDKIGNLYIADAYNNRIRKIDISTGVISTFAGNGGTGLSGDGGPATAANVYDPLDVCFDKWGNLYIAEAPHYRIRKVDTNGIISTFAGIGGTFGFSGDGGPATNAILSEIWGICIDEAGNLYLADFGNGRVRKVNTSGVISTVAGNGSSTVNCGDGGPATDACVSPERLAIDKFGNLYITSNISDRVRIINSAGIISTIVGTGVAGYNGDNIQASSALLHDPSGLAIDSCGNVYIADLENARIRKVTYPHCNFLRANEQNILANISIYPNPTYDELHIDNIRTETNFALLNIPGIIEQSGKLKEGNNTIPLKPLPPGLYFLQLVDEEGNKTVRKIVKR